MRRRDFVSFLGASAVAPVGAVARTLGPIGARHVVVDRRIELMSIVHLLSGYFLTTQGRTAYKDRAIAFFAPHRNHPVVALATGLANRSFAFDSVPDLLLRLTEPPALAWRADLISDSPRGIPAEVQRNEFLNALRDFARVSRFGDFFDEHLPLYRRLVGQIEPIASPNVQALQSYVGAPLGRWQVIAGLLMHDGGFGPKFRRRDGTLETYALIGPDPAYGPDPRFGEYARLQDLVVHEFAHSLVNPITEQQSKIVDRYVSRFIELRTRMNNEGYSDWPTVVNEHVVRAVTACTTTEMAGVDAGREAVAAEVQHGFVYVPSLVERLELYRTDRRRWPTLAHFYPALLEAFGQSIDAKAA